MNAIVEQCRDCEKAGIGLCATGTCCRNTPAAVSPDTLLYRAAINCPHKIDDKSVMLHFDPAQPGKNALDQLALRLNGAVSTPAVGMAADEPDEVEQVIACLGDDAVKLRDEDQYVEMAENMDAAARLIAGLAGRPAADGMIHTGDRLTDMKANSIVSRDGYKWTGVVLRNAEGKRCIVESSAVRWLSNDAAWQLMHPAEHPASVEPQDDALATTQDLAMLIRQLAHALGKAAPEHRLVTSAVDYLKRKGLAGSPLRDGGHASE
ncbi:hypothetical protein A9R05_42455 (plasmid) [Burkholderia sp. KK1]|uniref:Uncharacterized protein n=1 Tax=Burkholderia sp. M701 TaxID=326454 RepID=V5YNN2_9BURK|nr:hypothetical protein [Burkholderia sp. M701]AQH05683.1 hypothetical protein A9R05_42455 [Burkholderia sp. KK1]BAO18928.1 hypothetical protein [Burkholderia sp. M701]